MKQYNKKPLKSGHIIHAVNGKYGIPSQSLKRFIFEVLNGKFKNGGSKPNWAGNYMSLPKSSWSNTQNSPPQDQRCHFNEI